MPNKLFIYVEWPLSQQWQEIAEEEPYYKEEFGEHLCSELDENKGIYVNKNFYDSFV